MEAMKYATMTLRPKTSHRNTSSAVAHTRRAVVPHRAGHRGKKLSDRRTRVCRALRFVRHCERVCSNGRCVTRRKGPRSFWSSCWPYLGRYLAPRGEWFRPTVLHAHVPADPHQGAPQQVRPSHELAVSFQGHRTVTLTRCMTQSRSSSISLRNERRPTRDAVCQDSEVHTVHGYTAADRSAPPHPPRKTLSAGEHLYSTFSVLVKCLAARQPCSPSDANLPGQPMRPIFNPHDNCSR